MWYEASIAGVYCKESDVLDQIVAIARDITDRKEIEKNLHLRNSELEVMSIHMIQCEEALADIREELQKRNN